MQITPKQRAVSASTLCFLSGVLVMLGFNTLRDTAERSVPDRATVASRFGRALQNAALAVDQDALIAPDVLRSVTNAMAARGKVGEDRLRDRFLGQHFAAALRRFAARGRGAEMLQARRIARLLNVHPEIEMVD